MTHAPSVLVVDDEAVLREELAQFLRDRGCSVDATGDGAEACRRIRARDFDVVVCDIRMPDTGGLEVLGEVKRWSPRTGVILITAYSSVRSAVEAFHTGASDYVVKPIVFEDILTKVQRLVEYGQLAAENRYLRKVMEDRHAFGQIVARSAAMEQVFALIRRVAPLDSTVLVSGESGTGKELVARVVHENSPRQRGPFAPINCGAIAPGLFESALFGHVKGAFTGAHQDQDGVFRAARGGTLFLDEIATLSLDLQTKLLRVLEEKKVLPVGGMRLQETDVRLVAATNQDLERAVEKGQFRSDLFYRLNVFPVHLPPLRERTEDIPPLVDHFIGRFNAELGLAVQGVERDAMANLFGYPWRGNVRELQNVIQRAMILCEGTMLTARELPPWHGPGSALDDLPMQEALKVFEREFIERTLRRHRTRHEAAKALGFSTTTLWRRMRDLGLAADSDDEPVEN
ncbi:MAG: sigma-54-dependent Fis family transcriptional regulator [Planctomycetes bacterium]|nr:sigma-54-dependent Fis family transcriptional regulator [Planctomycetota bacterium]